MFTEHRIRAAINQAVLSLAVSLLMNWLLELDATWN